MTLCPAGIRVVCGLQSLMEETNRGKFISHWQESQVLVALNGMPSVPLNLAAGENLYLYLNSPALGLFYSVHYTGERKFFCETGSLGIV